GPVRQVSAAGRSQPGRASSDQPVLAERAVDERAVTELGQRLDIADGPVLDALLVSPDGGQPARLAIAAHGLVLDRASWRVLLEDLETAYRQLAKGQQVALPPASIEFGQWAGQFADM